MKNPVEILLVEDSPADIALTEEALKESGLQNTLTIVTDGEQAIEYLSKRGKYKDAESPDLILLDLNMPKKNGHEVLEVIKDNPKLEEIPVVVLTVSEAEEDIARALGLKMNYYLNKPVNVQKLAPILTTIIELWN
ncbi:MAG TPA: response regulator [Candidatus Melainabacteria bacterium]|nr:response regulator [Candidatus Melainabacteria bacterium]HIN63647.1 response regulator [Candidatus Obscuribacterales bacterium]